MEQRALLQTKLHIPPVRPGLVSRPRLIERLNSGLNRKLTLISAPAGFGKTTLVSEWVHRLGAQRDAVQVAWLSLDEGESDLVRFLAYLIAALRTIEADMARGVSSALQSPGAASATTPPPAEAILTSLINDLAILPDPIVLVLDDYHLIESAPVDKALAFLLDHLPRQVHLVIATREDPYLPLARLRARGQLTELRAIDLRFTPSEAAEFLDQAMGLDLSAQDVTALEARTEGWIAGLHLAALAMQGLALQGSLPRQGHKDTASFVRSFTGSHRFVLDYLVEEVLERQPQSVQTFLLQTAILDRLTGTLCDAVRFGSAKPPDDQDNGQAILEMLDRANLFIVPLDNERRWYRYHHLFADLLRQRLRQTHREQIPALHRRASEWYERKDLPSDAIRHALAVQDFERAAGLAELAWPAWSVGFRAIAWLGWVKDLPEEIVRARPVLSMAYAWAFLNAGRLEDADIKLRHVERWLDPPEAMSDRPQAASSSMVVVDEEQFRALPISLAYARAYHAQATGDVQGTAEYVRRALDLLPEDDHYNRAAVAGLLGLAYWASGDLEAAHRVFSDGLFQNIHDTIKGTFVLADMKMTLGRLHEAERACEHGLQLARAYDPPMPVGTEDVYTAISELHRERGDLEAAAQDLAASKQLGARVKLPDWQHRWCIAQARLKETLGDLQAALDLLEEADRLYVRTPVPDVRPIAAMKARVWAEQGRLTEAIAWARERDLSADDDLSYLREFEHITLARVLIARYRSDGSDDSVHEAIGLLGRLLQAAEEAKRTGSVLQILALQALAHEAQGNTAAALVPLERALALAKPEGYCQLFVDEGPPMAHLLYEALGRGMTPAYVRRLLAAFPIAEPVPARPSSSQSQESDLIEPLSEREREVLQLVAEGLTNREIASHLFLSLNTVKGHTRNIYGKLAVHSRTQAIARSQELGLLPRR